MGGVSSVNFFTLLGCPWLLVIGGGLEYTPRGQALLGWSVGVGFYKLPFPKVMDTNLKTILKY